MIIFYQFSVGVHTGFDLISWHQANATSSSNNCPCYFGDHKTIILSRNINLPAVYKLFKSFEVA